MKVCPNPNCSAANMLHSDFKTVCPYCHTALVNNNGGSNTGSSSNRNYAYSGASGSAAAIVTPDSIPYSSGRYRSHSGTDSNDSGYTNAANGDIPFATRIAGGTRYHGRIVEIEHHEVFNSRWNKIFNSVFRGEPYQFAHQTMEYSIRLENITDSFSTETTDAWMYGNFLGRIHVGDEVIVDVRNHRDRRVVRNMFNRTTNSPVRPGIQLPAAFVRVLAILAVLVILFLAIGAIWLVRSGTLWNWIKQLIAAILPTIIFILILWWIIRRIFSGRR